MASFEGDSKTIVCVFLSPPLGAYLLKCETKIIGSLAETMLDDFAAQ